MLCCGFRDRYSLCCVQGGLGATHAGSCSTQRAAWFGARHHRQDGTVHCHSHPVRQEKTASSACLQISHTPNVCCAQSQDAVHTFAGLRVERATVASSVLGKVNNLYINITSTSVNFLEISLPSLWRPLTVTLRGVNVELMQRTLPQV